MKKIKLLFRILLVFVFTVVVLPTNVNAQMRKEKFSVVANKNQVNLGNQFEVILSGQNIVDMYGCEIVLDFDETKLELADLLDSRAKNDFVVQPTRTSDGKVYFAFTKTGEQLGETGNFEIAKITFKAKAQGNHRVGIDKISLVDSLVNKQDFNLNETIHIQVVKPDTGGGSADKDKEDKEDKEDNDKEEGREEEEKDQEIVLIPGNPEKLTDIDYHWAKDSIEKVVRLGYMVGRTETSFNPKGNLTRAEMAVVLNRMVPFKATNLRSFEDLNGEEWYAQSIANMAEIGLLSGYENNIFKPKNNIKRSEVMAILASTARYKGQYQAVENMDQVLLPYNDSKDIPQWAKADIAWCVKEGIIKGDDKNNLNPTDYITRAEVAAIISRIL